MNAEGLVRASLIQPEEMADRYPLCWTYLCARKDELGRRNIVGGPAGERQWYTEISTADQDKRIEEANAAGISFPRLLQNYSRMGHVYHFSTRCERSMSGRRTLFSPEEKIFPNSAGIMYGRGSVKKGRPIYDRPSILSLVRTVRQC